MLKSFNGLLLNLSLLHKNQVYLLGCMKPNSCIKLPVGLCLCIACRLEIQRLAVRPLCDMHIWQSCLQSCVRQWCVSCENQIMIKLQEKLIKEVLAIGFRIIKCYFICFHKHKTVVLPIVFISALLL